MAVIEYLSVVLALDHSKFDGQVQQAAKSVSQIGKALVGASAIDMATNFGIDAIKIAASAETAAIQFETLLGSAEKAREAIAAFRQIDKESPLGFGEISQAAKTMLAFGVSSDDLSKRLRQLADVSMGNQERFQSLALAFGQTTAAGRLMGQESLQFVNAGLSPLQQLSKSTGISMVELKKAMEEGSISIDMVGRALDEATGAGGLFYQMSERVGKSTEGQWAKLTSDITDFKREVGEGLLPVVKELTAELRDMVQVGRDLKIPELVGGISQLSRASAKFSGGALTPGAGSLFSNMRGLLDPIGMLEKQRQAIFGDRETKAELEKVGAIKEASKERSKQNDSLRESLMLEMNRSKIERERQEKEKQATKAIADEERRIQKTLEDQKRLREQSMQDAFDIRKSLDPRLGVREEIDKALSLMQGGYLSRSDYERFKQATARDFAESQINRPQDTPFAAKGSVEAYRLLMQRDADRKEERQILQTQAELLASVDRRLANAPPIGVLRR